MIQCACNYCGRLAMLVTGTEIYPHRKDLGFLRFWQCKGCDAYVGCHKRGAPLGGGRVSNGAVPLGTLANAELRRARGQVHAAFDAIWKEGGMTRTAAYSWLQHHMGLQPDDCHIAKFNVAQCERALELCTKRTVAA